MIAKFSRKDFLEALFADYYKEHRGFTLVKSFKRGDAKMSTRYFPNIDILAKEQYGDDRDVYFGICPRERMKAEKEHIHYIVALWADLDIGSEGHDDKQIYFDGPREAAKAIRSFPRAPSIIVESGRGAHLYWLLREVTEVSDPERLEGLLRKINEFLQCDTDVNLDTVLRLPETVNTKIPSRPVNCEVKFINSNFRYTLQDFENLGHRVAGPSPGPAATQARHAGPPGSPSFGEKPPAATPLQRAARPETSITDSLVLDETIIDELIDDISMTGTVVTNAPTSSTGSGSFGPEQESSEYPNGSEEELEVVAPLKPAPPPVASSTGLLQRVFSSRKEVEIALVGSEEKIHGILTWNQDGLIGIDSGEDFYTIPLSSISYIKAKVR